jgi:hypothetical protein
MKVFEPEQLGRSQQLHRNRLVVLSFVLGGNGVFHIEQRAVLARGNRPVRANLLPSFCVISGVHSFRVVRGRGEDAGNGARGGLLHALAQQQ